jgi:hypothetical protein
MFIAVASILANSPAVAQSLKEQAACAAQAERFYRAYNNVQTPPGFKLESEDYQSHYNTKLNKCLILINEVSEYNGEILMSEELDDAFERRMFANYILGSKNNMRYCYLAPTPNKRLSCSSKQQFDSFVAKYMEQ